MPSPIHRVILDLMTGSLPALSEWVKEDSSRLHAPLGPQGFTPLHWAVQHGHHNLAAWLISRGAAVDALSQGDDPCTPLLLAAGLKKPQMVRMLVRAGADPWGSKAAWMAAYTGDVEFLQALEQEPKANFRPYIWKATTTEPSTDLVMAAIQGQAWEAARWMVEKGWLPHREPLSWPDDSKSRWSALISQYQQTQLATVAKPRRYAKARL